MKKETKKAQEPNKEEMSEEEMLKVRENIRKQFRENFGKWMEVSDEEATKEDVEAATKEFESEVAKYQNQMYLIHEADKTAAAYPALIQKWNKKYGSWEKGQWKGVIELDKVMQAKIDELTADENKPFEVDYATLFYLYNAMNSPKGTGLESALEMAEFENYDLEKNEIKDNENFVTYSNVLQTIYNHMRQLSNVDKKLKIMREKINIAQAGIKISWKISEIEEFIELHDAWLGKGVEDDMKNEN